MTGSVVADWCILDVVAENNTLQRIATPQAATQLWQLHKLPSPAAGDKGKRATGGKKYFKELELCNGERVGIECGLPNPDDFFVCYLEGRGKIFGCWLFARHPFLQSGFHVPSSSRAVVPCAVVCRVCRVSCVMCHVRLCVVCGCVRCDSKM
jgi:hypothetical protein